ncbi:MAG: hypothetical protein BWK76_15865, partial [Desulfobulbaceae bacterium A2]
TDWVLGQFSEKMITARQRYRQFVAEGMAEEGKPWEKLVGQVFLGSEKFVARMQELLEGKKEIPEIPRSQRYPGRPPLNRLFAGTSPGNKQQRNRRITEAHIAYGYTLKEIADFLGVHYTTVSKVVGGRMKK